MSNPEPSTESARDAKSPIRDGDSDETTKRSGWSWALRIAWAAQIILLPMAFSAFFHEGRLADILVQRQVHLLAPGNPGLAPGIPVSAEEIRNRLAFLGSAAAVAVLCLLTITCGLFFGGPKHRSIRSWLGLTALIAAWLLILSAWPHIAWAGQKWRVGRHIDAFEKIAAPLRADWPKDDSETPDLGAFSAYPIGEPRTLMLLTTPPSAKGGAEFNQIERTPDGALRFQLIGNEFGSWLEWYPEGTQPASYVGGLETRYTLLRSSPLRNGWRLTQYDARILE